MCSTVSIPKTQWRATSLYIQGTLTESIQDCSLPAWESAACHQPEFPMIKLPIGSNAYTLYNLICFDYFSL